MFVPEFGQHRLISRINAFLEGNIPTENVRFRPDSLVFVKQCLSNAYYEGGEQAIDMVGYPSIRVEHPGFVFTAPASGFVLGSITLLVGQNGTGKSTFLEGIIETLPSVSYKPQSIKNSFRGTVKELFMHKIRAAFSDSMFYSDVIRPLKLGPIMDRQVRLLSGGEAQRVAICICLGTPAQSYLLDEPSAYLDAEQRVFVSKVLKRFVNTDRLAVIVEHDLMMVTYLASSVIVFSGVPGKDGKAGPVQNLMNGMNEFLRILNITFRREQGNYRPRINLEGSVKDREQKANNNYFL